MSWWDTRRENEPTNEYLGRVLDALGAQTMAVNARAYHYDDYFCPPEVDDGMNMIRLRRDLLDWARHSPRANDRRVKEVADAVVHGEFDGTKAESEAWAASPDGRETFRELLGD
jgi:hypothetical protein